MKRARLIVASALLLLSALPGAAKSREEKQAELRKKAADTLERLYKVRPSARAAVKNAAGYAVFNNGGTKILIAGAFKSSLKARQAVRKLTVCVTVSCESAI